jgi:hypothetical protein
VGTERTGKLYTHLQFVINAAGFEGRRIIRSDAEVPPTENFVREDVLHVSCGFNECPTIGPRHTVTLPGHQ